MQIDTWCFWHQEFKGGRGCEGLARGLLGVWSHVVSRAGVISEASSRTFLVHELQGTELASFSGYLALSLRVPFMAFLQLGGFRVIRLLIRQLRAPKARQKLYCL